MLQRISRVWFLGEVFSEQQMQTVVAVGDVQEYNRIKHDPRTLRDSMSSQKTGSYSELIWGSEKGLVFHKSPCTFPKVSSAGASLASLRPARSVPGNVASK